MRRRWKVRTNISEMGIYHMINDHDSPLAAENEVNNWNRALLSEQVINVFSLNISVRYMKIKET